MTCALHSDKQVTQTFTIGGVTDESYYTAILGYPPTIITSDQVVKNFANESITLKIGVKYTKEYDRNIEKEILKLLEANGKEKDLSWDSKIEEADEIKNAQGYMPQIGMGIVLILAYICSKCAKSYDRIFHHGEHWNDAKTASFDADQGRDFVR